MSEKERRPESCCGVCPEIEGGGYDCTCEGNPRCPSYEPELDNELLPESLRGVPLMRAECCRAWPVFIGVRMGRCGYCGEVPVVTGEWEAP